MSTSAGVTAGRAQRSTHGGTSVETEDEEYRLARAIKGRNVKNVCDLAVLLTLIKDIFNCVAQLTAANVSVGYIVQADVVGDCDWRRIKLSLASNGLFKEGPIKKGDRKTLLSASARSASTLPTIFMAPELTSDKAALGGIGTLEIFSLGVIAKNILTAAQSSDDLSTPDEHRRHAGAILEEALQLFEKCVSPTPNL